MKLTDFLNSVAGKTNQQTNENFVALLKDAALQNVEINDDLARAMDSSLMSLNGAKNNDEVARHFKALALKSADDRLNAFAQALNIADDDFTAENNTYKRIDLLRDKVQNLLKDSPILANNAQEVARLTRELKSLEQKLTAATQDKDAALQSLKAEHAKEMLSQLVNFELSGKQYSNTAIENATNVTIARAVLQDALAKKGAIVVNENGSLQLKQAANPELSLLDDGNRPVSFSDFTNQTLAAAHLLKVNDGNTGANNSSSNSGRAGNIIIPPAEGNSAAVAQAVQESLLS